MAMTARDRVRLELSDTDVRAPLFTDAELDQLLLENGDNPLLAAAAACDILATRYAAEFDFDSLDQKSFKVSKKAQAYERRAQQLRERASRVAGVSVMQVQRVDGYSCRRRRGDFDAPCALHEHDCDLPPCA
jgi:hypothetical protein